MLDWMKMVDPGAIFSPLVANSKDSKPLTECISPLTNDALHLDMHLLFNTFQL